VPDTLLSCVYKPTFDISKKLAKLSAAFGICKSITDAFNLTFRSFLEMPKATLCSTHLRCFLLITAEAACSLSSLACTIQPLAFPIAQSAYCCGNENKALSSLVCTTCSKMHFSLPEALICCGNNKIKAQMWMLPLQPPLPYVYQSLFKHKVKIVDENGEAWTVQYEGFVSAAQRHYRFTAGWTNLVKQKGIKVGKPLTSSRTLT